MTVNISGDTGVSQVQAGAIEVTDIPNNTITGDKIVDDAITVNKLHTSAQGALGTRNLIINGDMRIAQRGTGTTGLVAAGFYDIDRVFYTESNVDGSFDSAQSTDVPSGQNFINSHKWSVNSTATALTTTGWAQLRHVVEGLNSAHLGWGTANAKTVTLSFWVKASVTGTYCISINNDGFDRCYIAEYTINTANTWEKKTITIEGDTSGTWKTDNDRGIIICWALDAGADRKTTADSWQSGGNMATSNQVSWISNAGATFYRTGLQLEVGDTATEFEHRPYDMELARCQRYYYLHCEGNQRAVANGAMYTAAVAYANIKFPVNMRADPSLEVTSGNNFRAFAGNGTSTATAVGIWSQGGTTNEFISLSGLARTQGQACFIDTNNAACKLAFASEL